MISVFVQIVALDDKKFFHINKIAFLSKAPDAVFSRDSLVLSRFYLHQRPGCCTLLLFRRSAFTIDKPLSPPAGYASWLDYAVECFDTRAPWLDRHFERLANELAGIDNDSLPELDREEIRESARIELWALRKAAAAASS